MINLLRNALQRWWVPQDPFVNRLKKKRGADGLDLAGFRQGPSLRIRGI